MNAISVANVAIRQFDNLYSLNDLHKASGGEKRHQPANWLRSQQTIDLIEYLKSEESEPIQKKQGLGTFVCKELVVHYGMWISPAFSLKVIRVFLDTQEAVSGSPKLETKTTIDERRGLVEAVKAFAIRRNLDYSSAFRMVHQRFGVVHIDQIAAPLLPSAVAYVHSLTLQNGLNGEVLDAPPKAKPKLPIDGNSLADIAAMVYYGAWMIELGKDISAPLKQLGNKQAVTMWTVWHETRSRLKRAVAALEVLRKYTDKDTSDRIAVCLEGIYSKASVR